LTAPAVTLMTASRRKAALTKHHGPDHPATLEASRDLRAAHLEEHIKRLVDDAPPLTSDQLARLAGLLFSGTSPRHA
jgi:hypothetical protein